MGAPRAHALPRVGRPRPSRPGCGSVVPWLLWLQCLLPVDRGPQCPAATAALHAAPLPSSVLLLLRCLYLAQLSCCDPSPSRFACGLASPSMSPCATLRHLWSCGRIHAALPHRLHAHVLALAPERVSPWSCLAKPTSRRVPIFPSPLFSLPPWPTEPRL